MSLPGFVNMKFTTYQEADEFITKWALEQSIVGQGFLVKKGSLDKCRQSKTPVGRNLYCKFSKCPWKVNLRKHLIDGEEKWEVTSYVLAHNHELSFTLENDAKKRSSASALYNEMVAPLKQPPEIPYVQLGAESVLPVNYIDHTYYQDLHFSQQMIVNQSQSHSQQNHEDGIKFINSFDFQS